MYLVENKDDKFFVLLNKMKNRKGQVQSLAPAILALVFAAVVLVMGLVLTQSLTDSRDGSVTSTSAVNESIAITGSGTTAALAAVDNCGFVSLTPTTIYNGSTAEILVLTTDYTVSSTAGTITNVTFVATPLLVTYTYTWGGEACEAGNSTVYGLGTFADFWEIIVLAIVITVVIGLLLIVFGGKQRR